jgi:hypothetical protein
MLAAAQRPGNSSECEFVEIDEIILSVGRATTLPPEPPMKPRELIWHQVGNFCDLWVK